MNNAAYAVHFELARWELGAASGVVPILLRRQGAFIVASMAMRFRRELQPLAAFEIHTSLHAADDRQMWLRQTMRMPGSDEIMAAGMCRAVLRRGKGVISPLEIFRTAGADSAAVDVLEASKVPRSETEALSILEKALTSS